MKKVCIMARLNEQERAHLIAETQPYLNDTDINWLLDTILWSMTSTISYQGDTMISTMINTTEEEVPVNLKRIMLNA